MPKKTAKKETSKKNSKLIIKLKEKENTLSLKMKLVK